MPNFYSTWGISIRENPVSGDYLWKAHQQKYVKMFCSAGTMPEVSRIKSDAYSPERVLAEVEDVLRTAPPPAIWGPIPLFDEWLGRAFAALEAWDVTQAPMLTQALLNIRSNSADLVSQEVRTIIVLLHQAQNDLRMETGGPVNMAIGAGRVFEYFDELRKIVELANQEVFFVDPYLDPDFVSRYLPFVRDGVAIRLLTSQDAGRLSKLLPAVDLYAKQSGRTVAVRSTTKLHDRYLFVDQTSCYHSGASFKDGAKKAGTVISQISDAFSTMWTTYDNMWQASRVDT